MKIGITGATGHLGRLVVKQLKEKVAADHIVALVRNTQKAAELGVESRIFDYDKPETLSGSLQGIDHLLLISGNEIGQRKTQHENVIRAAQEAGVKWIVYTSLLHADTSSLSLAEEHLLTEKALQSSGIPYTILRNGWYTENYTASVPAAITHGVLIGSAGEGQISSAARADYAEAAAVVLTSSNEQGKVYELVGDEAYTLADLATEISKQTGKTIPYQNLSEAEYTAALIGAGLPEGLAAAFASFDVGASKGDLYDNNKQLSSLIGRPTTTLAAAVREALAV
ncbi:SDR family oxidoreductase [Sphingobacterium faecium]|jgi:NAD(P)H dehydrogenase (quinone)|uniref:SDR family oxidoreductase n=1 Tax=Sphingobacterium faecium TaxID=34087 RepID=UPI00097EE2FD|nr:SDR family oxidoreductase [Sphingobacterium faecium]WGQ15271.1 SDR family oxidoreductase [Sphingobacterium faecium]SJN26528.1 NADPH:quinone oxidoreductase 2 [Sphingobacterium faecium PCAi_F2.5]